MKLTWAFEVGSVYFWAFDNKTLGGHNYVSKILKDSFSGMTLRWDLAGNGLIAPNEITFDVSDTGFTLYGVDYTGWEVIVRIYEGTTEKRAWKMICSRSVSEYGKVRFYCQDFLQDLLDGNYPKTQNPKTVWPSSDADPGDYVIPVILGQGYVPVISVNTGTQRYYPIGKSTSVTYTISEVQSPHDWNLSSTWSSEEYDFNQSNLSSLARGLQVIIADSDGDDFADAPGVWKSGDTFLPMLTKMTRSDTYDIINPAGWIDYFCQDIGISGTDIDSTSFSDAETLYGTLEFNGGWWHSETRENALSSMLSQCDSYINISDKIELYRFSATEVEMFGDLIENSYRVSKISPSKVDSGYAEWQESGKPQDILSGKKLVSASTTTDNPSSEIFSARFISDSVNAQKAAILYYQKKYLKKNSISFSVAWPSISTRASIHPGQVVKINNQIYGDTQKPIITQMQIRKDFRVDFQGVVLSTMSDWGSVSPDPSEIDIASGDVDFAWDKADEIIDTVTEVIDDGGLLNNVHLGFTGTTDGDSEYDFVGFHYGGLFTGETLLKIPFVRDITFAVNLGSGTITSKTEPAFDVILKVFKNDSEIGFIEFVAGDVNGIINVPETSFTTADTFSIVCQSVSDGWGILTGIPEFVWDEA